MSYRAAKTGIAMYSIVYACIDWYKDIYCQIGLYRLVKGCIELYRAV